MNTLKQELVERHELRGKQVIDFKSIRGCIHMIKELKEY